MLPVNWRWSLFFQQFVAAREVLAAKKSSMDGERRGMDSLEDMVLGLENRRMETRVRIMIINVGLTDGDDSGVSFWQMRHLPKFVREN